MDKYNYPIFTHDIVIEQGTRPHSHPTLTLNTRPQTDIEISEQFIHEQFHWYLTDYVGREKYLECIEYLKGEYSKPEGDVGSTENGFWLHLIVNYNVRIVLEEFFGSAAVKEMHSSGWVSYKQIEEVIDNNWKKLTQELSRFDMIYQR